MCIYIYVYIYIYRHVYVRYLQYVFVYIDSLPHKSAFVFIMFHRLRKCRVLGDGFLEVIDPFLAMPSQK